jgi:hypothetical protein
VPAIPPFHLNFILTFRSGPRRSHGWRFSKDPNQRFQSAVDLRLALEDMQAQAGADITPSIAVMPFTNLSSDKDLVLIRLAQLC